MGDPKGFLTNRERELPQRRPVPLRILDWKEVYETKTLSNDEAATQAGRCMDCGIPFCHIGCPLGNLIPEWNDLVYHQEWKAASDRLHATNNFPEFTGRLCPAPCEGSCVLAISQPAVTIEQTEKTIAERAWENDDVTPVKASFFTGQKVAVVGSGPAGLAAAQQLTRAGHAVTVFERNDKIGGLLRYGIPEFKMEKWVIDRRLEQMRAEGTNFRTNVNVGVDVTVEQLREDYDAVVLAGGATVWRDLPIPGRDLNGIHQAMEYLPWGNRYASGEINAEQVPIDAEGKKVIVIGGGDTSNDCLGTATRQGAESVIQFEIMPKPPASRAASTPWPVYPLMYRVASANEENGERMFQMSTTEFVDDGNGNVRALKGYKVEMRDGKFEPIDGTDFEIEADLVLIAMGFVGPERGDLLDKLGVDYTPRGAVERDKHFATTVDGVFVAGDMGRGQSLIVWAIAEGRSAAAAVDRYLMGETALPAPIRPTDVAQR